MTLSWDDHADWWVSGFGAGRDPVWAEQILPLAADLLAGRGRVVDLGCGEGQLLRRLAPASVGLDASPLLLRAAAAAGPGSLLVTGDVTALPFADASFGGAAIVLVLEHVEDVGATIGEVSRVLVPGGRLVVFLNHPLFQAPGAGWVEDHVLGEAYWRVGGYLVESVSEEEVEAGVRLPFHHRPLSTYLNCLADAGFVLERMLEPAPPPGYLDADPGLDATTSIPRLAVLVASLIDVGT